MNHNMELLSRYLDQPLLLSEEGSRFLSFLGSSKLNREPTDFLKQAMIEQGVADVSLLRFGMDSEYKPYPMTEAGIAVLTVNGTLEANSNWYGNYWTGYEAIESRFAYAMHDPDVRGIALTINSHGGEAAGCFECADLIASHRGEKPIRALVKHSAYSAAYAVATGADMIAGTPSAGLGSIGVIVAHADQSKMMERIGIDVTLIHAGSHKADGNPFEPLPEAVRERIQTRVDALYATFVKTVAQNRNIKESVVKGTDAGTFQIQEAIELGLADKEQTVGDFFQEFEDDLRKPNSRGMSAMASNTPDQAAAQVAAQAAAQAAAQPTIDVAKLQADSALAERTRIESIMNCEEAKDRTKLASHVALKTNMSLEDAKTVLAAAAGEAPAPAPRAGKNPLENAMDQEGDADLGAGGDTGAAEQSAAQKLFAGLNQKRAK
ncbi:MAG: hypothetical protein DRQ98_10135 [Gammaproteobacteria bacterium]|nr:MAG: hypothetical protein DRQ98_10135 [Gammaproteobacteria bacterium]